MHLNPRVNWSEFILLNICGLKSWEEVVLVHRLLAYLYGMHIMTIRQASEIGDQSASEDGLNHPLNSTLEIQLFALEELI